MGWSFIICFLIVWFHLTRAPPVLSGKVASSFEEIDQSSNFKNQSIKTTAKHFLEQKASTKVSEVPYVTNMSQLKDHRHTQDVFMLSCERDMFSHCVILIIIVMMMMMMMFCVIIIQAAGRSNSGSTRSWILCNSFCNSSPTSPESSSTSSSWLQQQQHRFYQLHHNYSLSPLPFFHEYHSQLTTLNNPE